MASTEETPWKAISVAACRQPSARVARVSDEHGARAGLEVLRRQHLRHDLGADAGDVAEHQADYGSGIGSVGQVRLLSAIP
jgi:hypothetical protein